MAIIPTLRLKLALMTKRTAVTRIAECEGFALAVGEEMILEQRAQYRSGFVE
jgi:hypothetical protein